MAQGQSTKIISTIKWIRTRRLSVKSFLSSCNNFHCPKFEGKVKGVVAVALALLMRTIILLIVKHSCSNFCCPKSDSEEFLKYGKVDIRLSEKGDSKSHGARPVY